MSDSLEGLWVGRADSPNTYQLGKRLGVEGGQGSVYAATQPSKRDAFAIKVMHSAHDRDQVIDQGIAFRLTDIDCEYLVRVRDLFSGPPPHTHSFDTNEFADARTYLVMDQVAGISFDKWAARNHGDLRPLATIAEALAQMHEAGVAHCDVKPYNIMVDGRGAGHLVDLGSARELGTTIKAKTSVYAPADRGTATPAFDGYSLAKTAVVALFDFDNAAKHWDADTAVEQLLAIGAPNELVEAIQGALALQIPDNAALDSWFECFASANLAVPVGMRSTEIPGPQFDRDRWEDFLPPPPSDEFPIAGVTYPAPLNGAQQVALDVYKFLANSTNFAFTVFLVALAGFVLGLGLG